MDKNDGIKIEVLKYEQPENQFPVKETAKVITLAVQVVGFTTISYYFIGLTASQVVSCLLLSFCLF